MIRVVSPGVLTTVQDLGRPGRASAGVPPSGAMDALALRTANLLAGNPEGAAALEVTMTGPFLTFEADAVVALAGAYVEADIDGDPVSAGESFPVAAGRSLRLGRVRGGVRSYVAVRGGIVVPAVLGSSSTHVGAGLGGWRGRALAARDYLRIGVSDGAAPMRRLAADPALSGAPGERVVRAVPGPQEDAFTPRGTDAFFGRAFTVSPRSDRTGVRLDGDPVEASRPADVDPEGVVTGAVQVPGDGLPIVLGPDRPVTGGYVKIATVITADLPAIAQARPGDTLRFVPVDVEHAQDAWRRQEWALARAIEDLPGEERP